MLKPIIRWIIGPVSPEGFECLHLSVKLIKNIYQSQCKYIICHNNLSRNQQNTLPIVDQIVNQNNLPNCIPYQPPVSGGKTAWKLYPPRIDCSTHEIILDNDVLIYKKPKFFDEFFTRNDLFVTTQSFRRSYSSKFDADIPENFNINSGVLCLPPNYNYQKEISDKLLSIPGKWEDHMDEQTLIASILHQKITKIISLKEIYVCYNKYKRGNCGIHFVGLNNGFKNCWEMYKKCLFL